MAKKSPDFEQIKTIVVNFLLTVKAILLSPRVFFDQMISSGEGDWLETFYFFCVCAAIHAFMYVFMGYSVIHAIAEIHPFLLKLFQSIESPLFLFVLFMSSFLMPVFGSFIVSSATNFIAKALGGKGNNLDTYKVIACSSVVLLYSWIPYIGGPLSLYYFALVWIGISRAHELRGWKTFFSIYGGSTVYAAVSAITIFTVFFLVATYLNSELSGLFSNGLSQDVFESLLKGRTE